jgi:molybdopterin synthase catalytic subunit
MMTIHILFFATLKDRAGIKQTILELPEGTTVAQLKVRLAERFPGLLEALASVLVSVNREFAFDGDVLPPGAEVALFPPVSGGSGRFP